MKKNKVLKIVLTVLCVLVALLAAAALCLVLYVRSLAAELPDSLPEGDAASTELILTDDDLDKLLSGEISLDELTGSASASSGAEEDASASVPEQDAAASTDAPEDAASQAGSGTASASASKPGSSSSSGTGSSSSTASSKTEKPASSASHKPAAYEAEVKALVQQLYGVKARAEAELNSCIAGAKAEYKALPESQQTQARKISIALSRSGKLYSMQASYDREVDSIVNQMRTVLKANGQSTALADQALASYKAQKSAMYAQLKAKLYS